MLPPRRDGDGVFAGAELSVRAAQGYGASLLMDSDGEYAPAESYAENDIFGEVFAMPYGDLGYAVEADSDCEVMFIRFSCIYGRCPKACEHHSRLTCNLFELSAKRRRRWPCA